MPRGVKRKEHPLSMRLPVADIAMIDRAGNNVFNKYYPAPGQEGWKKALLIANAVYGSRRSSISTGSANFGSDG